MKWELIRPGAVRILHDNGTFIVEYHYADRVLLNTNRGTTTTVNLSQIDEEARALVANGITSATVAK